jgi:hypothetical protein
MDLQEIDKEVIRYMKVFAKLTPRPNKQRLYRVIGIKKAHECKEYKKLSNVLMETSNKKMQSWTTSIESAKQFYSDIYRSLSDRHGKNDVWLIVEADIPTKSIIMNWKDAMTGLDKLAEINQTHISRKTKVQRADSIQTIKDFIGDEFLEHQNEMIVFLSTKKALVKKVHVLSCDRRLHTKIPRRRDR